MLLFALLLLPRALASSPTARGWACNASLASQRWAFLAPPPGSNFSQLVLRGAAPLAAPPLALTPLNGTDSFLGLLPLATPAFPAQLWALQGGLLMSAERGRCAATTASVPGLPLQVVGCNASDPRQAWAWDGASGALSQPGAPLGPQCLDVGARLTCASPAVAGLPYCNPALPPAARAADLAARLTAGDLPPMLGGWYESAGAPRLGLNAFSFAEALHGLGAAGCGHRFSNSSWSNSGCATSFPHAPLLAASFNASLWASVGEAIGVEARGAGGGLLLWTPNVNTVRDARWGRAQEVCGEDSLLTGAYARAFVGALQRGVGGGPGAPLRAVATCKHLFAYDLEGRTGADDPSPTNYSRHTFDANISRKDLAEYFFPPMRACVGSGGGGGGALSAMSSINAVNGVPGAANAAFNVAQARGAWNFSGFLTSDCGTVSDLLSPRHFVGTPPAAVAAALRGGTDSNCGHFYNLHLEEALGQGLVTLAQARGSAARLLAPVFELGLADPPSASPFAGWGPERVDTPQHRALALAGAVQGAVLLRNTGGLLPLRLAGLRAVALVGPHLNASTAMQSSYAGPNDLVAANTPYLRLAARAHAAGVALRCALGVPTAHSNDTSGLPAAVAAAVAADVTIAFLGLDQTLEREGLDRVDTLLPPAQRALLAALAAGAPRTPLVVVLMGGGAISEAAEGAGALVVGMYPGELGGEALAQLLLGEAAFSGRLPFTVPAATWGARRDIRDTALAPHANPATGAPVPGATHWYMAPEDVLFPFGAGLGYVAWAWAWPPGSPCAGAGLSVDAGAWAAGAAAPAVAVRATNTGALRRGVSALGFASSGVAGEPLQKLFGFARAAGVGAGEGAELALGVALEAVARVDGNGTRTLEPGAYMLRVGGDAGGGGVVCALRVTGARAFVDALAF